MNILNPDSPVMRFLSRFFDLIVLNALFLVCCIPLFTIGASITAMYSVSLKMVRDEECYIAKAFFASFKKNLKTATLLFIPFFLLGGFFLWELLFIIPTLEPSYAFLRYPVMALLIMLCCGYLYMYPLLSFFDAPVKQLIKNSFLLSLGHLPTTIIVLCLHIFVLLIIEQYQSLLVPILSLFMFFGFAAMALLYSYYYRKVFDKHMPPEEPEAESDSEWNWGD